jgi:hypothetical protein
MVHTTVNCETRNKRIYAASAGIFRTYTNCLSNRQAFTTLQKPYFLAAKTVQQAINIFKQQNFLERQRMDKKNQFVASLVIDEQT